MSSCPVTHTLRDECGWATHNFEVAATHHCFPESQLPEHVFAQRQGDTRSTAFSGIDAAGCANNISRNACSRRCATSMPGTTLPMPPHIHTNAVEFNQHCFHELMLVPNGPACIHGDIMSFCSPELQQYCALLTEFDVDVLKPMFLRPGAVRNSAHCMRHGRHYTYRHTTGHIQGSPCTVFSARGAQLGTCGPTICFWLAWAALMLLVQPVWMLCENVEQFPVSIVEAMFSFCYNVSSVVLCGTSFGKPVRRRRRYTLLVLRSVASLCRSLSDISTFRRELGDDHTLHDYKTAERGELLAELRWAHARKSNTSGNVHLDRVNTFTSEQFLSGLLDAEKERLDNYIADHNGSEVVVSVGQDPKVSPTTSTPTILHCITRSCHIMWCQRWGRWLTVREMLLAQGFPTCQAALAAVQGKDVSSCDLEPMCSFNVSRLSMGLPPRDRVDVAHQCGNSMQVEVVGTCMFFISLYVRETCRPAPALHIGHQLSQKALLLHDATFKRRAQTCDDTQSCSGQSLLSIPAPNSAPPSKVSRTTVATSVSSRSTRSSKLLIWATDALHDVHGVHDSSPLVARRLF